MLYEIERLSDRAELSLKIECEAAERFKLGGCKFCRNLMLRLEQIEHISS